VATKKPKQLGIGEEIQIPGHPEFDGGEPIRIKVMLLTDLADDPDNPRAMDDDARAGLSESLRRYGMKDLPCWNEKTGELVGGHQRIKDLRAAGVESIPVVVTNADRDRQREMNVALNNPHIGGYFTKALGEQLRLIAAGVTVPDFELLGFKGLTNDLDEIARKAQLALQKSLAQDKPVEPLAVQVCEPGDVWKLNDHRIMCGDATDADAYAALTVKRMPGLLVTDPPYGVEYDPKWREEVDKRWRYRTGKVTGDDQVDWSAAFEHFKGDVAYVWHAGIHAGAVADLLAKQELFIRTQIIWRKQSIVMGRGAYHWQHEPCWYAVRKGKRSHWIGDRKQSTIWDIENVHRTQGTSDDMITQHGTQKPVECMGRPIRHHNLDVVYDPFLGSGTTLIAAEQLGDRICLGMDIDPVYIDMALHRWATLTGDDPIRESDGASFGNLLSDLHDAGASMEQADA